jgi:hypothetical protein
MIENNKFHTDAQDSVLSQQQTCEETGQAAVNDN